MTGPAFAALTLVLWAALLYTAVSAAAQTPAVRDAVDAHRAAIIAAESEASPNAVESAFASVETLRAVLLAREADGKRSVIETLSEAEFAALEQLPSVFVQRVEVLVVRPEPRFFVALAERAGDRADRRFAAALAATYPNAKWPVYIQPQTDYSGCTAFGEGSLRGAYVTWSELVREFPGRYELAVAQERDRVWEEIAESTCACGDEATVIGELLGIVRTLSPNDPILPAVRERLAAVEAGRSDIRFDCRSG